MALSKSSSSNYIALWQKHSSSASITTVDGRHEAYKALVTEVADSLMEEDVEKIMWLYDIPKKAPKGYSPLDVLTNLHKNGKLSENNSNGLGSLLERIKRKDLVEKYLTPFHQTYEGEQSRKTLLLSLSELNSCMHVVAMYYDMV